MSRIHRGILAPLVLGIAGVAVLLALGFWQLQRLEWKQGVIAELETRLAAEPVPLPEAPDPESHRLLRVSVTGRLGQRELQVIASIKRVGPGYRVIVPMEIAADGQATGRAIMVDLGFVPERLKDPATRGDSQRAQDRGLTDEVIGLLHWPDEVDSFTPEPDLKRNIWFARDVAAMAEHLGTEPVLLIAERHPDGEMPLPLPPVADLPNRHLEYVLTWFGLALVWAVMTVLWARSEWRRREAEDRQSDP